MAEVKRADFFACAKQLKAQIEQLFTDVASWNKNNRKPGERPIDPDPNGTLVTILAYCNGILNGDVYIAPGGEGRDG